MKGLTKTTLWEFLELMRDRTRENIILIKHNNSLIIEIEKQNSENSFDNAERIRELRKRNKELSKENNELLELHKNIIAIGDKYGLYASEDMVKGAEESESIEIDEPADVNNLHVDELDFDNLGEWVKNKEVVEVVYEELLSKERYEECAKLKNYLIKQDNRNNRYGPDFFDKLKFWRR